MDRVVNMNCRQPTRCMLGVALAILAIVNVDGDAANARESGRRGAAFAGYVGAIHFHTGVCDASGVVALDATTVAVVDDEENHILVYDVGRSGPPRYTIDVANSLQPDEKHPEVDFEAGARINDAIYWISSHGRNKKGKKRDSRYRFVATRMVSSEGRVHLEPMGNAYQRLLEDLIDDPRYAEFGLKKAAKRAPKEPGALNIEGITDTPQGRLLIGFRNPVPDGKALIATLVNPAGVVSGEPARFDDPILLDLDDRGVRGMASAGGDYLLVAGPVDGQGELTLYRWDRPGSTPARLSGVELGDLTPEAVTFLPAHPPQVLLLSDDGTRSIDGEACKDLKDPTKKRFRSLLLTPSR